MVTVPCPGLVKEFLALQQVGHEWPPPSVVPRLIFFVFLQTLGCAVQSL
jgi:hypothetical protein